MSEYNSLKEKRQEEIAQKVVEKIDGLPFNIEISNAQLWNDLINENEFEFDDLIEIYARIIQLCKNKNYILNFDKYKDAIVGLPYNIPFIKEKKGEKKEITSFTIQYGNYLHIDSFSFFGYGENIKCAVEEIGELYKRDNKTVYVRLLPEDGYTITNIAKNILEKKEVIYEPLEGRAVYFIEFFFDNGTEKRISFTENEELCNKLKEIINRSMVIDLENILIQLSIYYFLSTKDIEAEITLDECCELLKEEKKFAMEGKTFFYVKSKDEHIINKLFDNIKGLNYIKYSELLEQTMLKMNYYYSMSKDNSIMSTESEKDVEEIANNIICFNIGTDELKNNLNPSAQYELGERYFYAGMDEIAYKYFQNAAEKGHKLANYRKILCLYQGYGIEKNETKAFEEARNFVEKFTCSKITLLLGEMYFLGRGVEQDYKKSFECFERYKDIEYSAQYYLGLMYIDGLGVEVDEKKGLEYITKAAKGRYKKAMDYIIDYNNRDITN